MIFIKIVLCCETTEQKYIYVLTHTINALTQSFLVRKNAQSRNGWQIKNRKSKSMLQIVDKDEVAERKPYKFGYEAVTKMLLRKKQKQIKKMKIANSIVKINSLVEAM